MKTFILVAVLFMVGCAQPVEITYIGDVNTAVFSAAQIEKAQALLAAELKNVYDIEIDFAIRAMQSYSVTFDVNGQPNIDGRTFHSKQTVWIWAPREMVSLADSAYIHEMTHVVLETYFGNEDVHDQRDHTQGSRVWTAETYALINRAEIALRDRHEGGRVCDVRNPRLCL